MADRSCITEVNEQFGAYSVGASTEFGPRLVSLRTNSGSEILASLDDSVGIPLGDGGVYRFRGGHRLWVAPEVPHITYARDDLPCSVSVAEGHLTVTGPPDEWGFGKELVVSVSGDRLQIDHHLTWMGETAMEVAPWAITQFPLGGTALLRLGSLPTTPSPQADRSLVLWPYTNLGDRRLSFRPDAVLVDATGGPALKLGAGPNPTMLGYFRNGTLFIKGFDSSSGQAHPDLGAVGQVYVNESFCELESTGPLVTLEPGGSTSHLETWQIVYCPDIETATAIVTGSEP